MGSNKFAFASEAKTISSELTASVKSMPDFLFEIYMGASVVTTAAAALGTIVDVAVNVKGTSLVDSDTGIVGVTIKAGSEDDLKDMKIVIKAVSATTVDVFSLTDITFDKGADLVFDDDLLKITTAGPLTIATGAATEIPNTGLELTGGSGTIAFVTDDTADARVAASHGGISEITIGKDTTNFPEHGVVMLSAKRSDQSLFEIEIFKAVGAGFPLAFEETVFSIPELTIKLLFDEDKNAIAKITATAG